MNERQILENNEWLSNTLIACILSEKSVANKEKRPINRKDLLEHLQELLNKTHQ